MFATKTTLNQVNLFDRTINGADLACNCGKNEGRQISEEFCDHRPICCNFFFGTGILYTLCAKACFIWSDQCIVGKDFGNWSMKEKLWANPNFHLSRPSVTSLVWSSPVVCFLMIVPFPLCLWSPGKNMRHLRIFHVLIHPWYSYQLFLLEAWEK